MSSCHLLNNNRLSSEYKFSPDALLASLRVDYPKNRFLLAMGIAGYEKSSDPSTFASSWQLSEQRARSDLASQLDMHIQSRVEQSSFENQSREETRQGSFFSRRSIVSSAGYFAGVSAILRQRFNNIVVVVLALDREAMNRRLLWKFDGILAQAIRDLEVLRNLESANNFQKSLGLIHKQDSRWKIAQHLLDQLAVINFAHRDRQIRLNESKVRWSRAIDSWASKNPISIISDSTQNAFVEIMVAELQNLGLRLVPKSESKHSVELSSKLSSSKVQLSGREFSVVAYRLVAILYNQELTQRWFELRGMGSESTQVLAEQRALEAVGSALRQRFGAGDG